MLRFLFCLVFIAPVFFLPGLISTGDAVARVETAENTYAEFTSGKLDTLEACEAASISIYFADEYVTTHSAEYLQSAVNAASDCEDANVRIVGLNYEDETLIDPELNEVQVEEVAEFVKAYEADVDLEIAAREIDVDTRAVNGRAVVVEFDFETDRAE